MFANGIRSLYAGCVLPGLRGLDIVIANAGISTRHVVGSGCFADDVHLIQTNRRDGNHRRRGGPFSSANHGQIVAISSVAAKLGMPGLGAYRYQSAVRLQNQCRTQIKPRPFTQGILIHR